MGEFAEEEDKNIWDFYKDKSYRELTSHYEKSKHRRCQYLNMEWVRWEEKYDNA